MKKLLLYPVIIFSYITINTSFVLASEKPKNDGSSFKKAIIVHSISEEYAFLQKMKLIPKSQLLVVNDGVYYDVFMFEDKLQKTIYFKLGGNDGPKIITVKRDSLII